jgi:hypothetical protein
MKELSMGMSSDLETAIEEGSTIVRVGTAVLEQEYIRTLITGMKEMQNKRFRLFT